MVTATASLVMALAVLAVHPAAAKRGCSAFGHSCFGGHGKRADDGVQIMPGSDADTNRLLYESAVASGDDDDRALATALGSLVRPPAGLVAPSQGLQLSPFLRQWLQLYRRPSSQSLETN